MPYTSPHGPIPPVPDCNIYQAFWNRPDIAEWPTKGNHTLWIDAATGQKRTYNAFRRRVEDAMTALGGPVCSGGFGLEYKHTGGGQGEGEIVAIISENDMEYPVLVHALMGLAIPYILISAYSTSFELAHAMRVSGCSRVFVSALMEGGGLLERVIGVAKTVGIGGSRVYCLNGDVKGRLSLADLIGRVRASKGKTGKSMKPVPPRPANRDDLAYLILSSGTTGLPKAVMVSHGNILASFTQAVIQAQILLSVHTPPPHPTPEGVPVTLAYLPMHHAYGLHAYIFRMTLAPATLVILRKWDVVKALECIPKYKVSMLTLIPSVVHQMVHHPMTAKTDLSTLRGVNNGAAHLPEELKGRFKDRIEKNGGEVAFFGDGYGLSEVTIAAMGRPFPGTVSPVPPPTAALLIPGMEARIMKDAKGDQAVGFSVEEAVECAEGESGELWLKGQNVVLGYYNNPKATAETFIIDPKTGERWLRTGDRFKVEGPGWFYFADRAKDILKVGGQQVSPSEIEETLMAQPDKLIIDVCVGGVSGGRTNDEKIPRAWIVLSPAGKKLGNKRVVEVLDKYHQESLSKYKWLRGGIEVVPEIPKNPTGKVLRRVLIDKYEAKLAKKEAKVAKKEEKAAAKAKL